MKTEQLLKSLSNCLTIDTASGTLYVYGSLQQGTIKSAVLYADADGRIIAAPSGSGGGSSSIGAANLTATGTRSSNTFLRGDNTWATLSSSTDITASGFIKSGGLSTQFLMANGSVSVNPGWLTSINSTMVTNALGYTPYNSTNPNGYLNETAANLLYLKLTGNGTVAGTITAYAFYESSDKRLKTLIKDNYQANGIESITAKLYTKNGVEELGYYAQDVKDVLPSAVSAGKDGYLNLSYREVHTAKIARLEKEVEELKAQLARL